METKTRCIDGHAKHKVAWTPDGERGICVRCGALGGAQDKQASQDTPATNKPREHSPCPVEEELIAEEEVYEALYASHRNLCMQFEQMGKQLSVTAQILARPAHLRNPPFPVKETPEQGEPVVVSANIHKATARLQR